MDFKDSRLRRERNRCTWEDFQRENKERGGGHKKEQTPNGGEGGKERERFLSLPA